MMMQRVIVSKHQKTSMYLGQWNRNIVPVGNYFGLDCMIEVYPHAFTVSERSSVEKDENPDRDMLFCVSSREIGRIETHSSQQHICRRYSSMSLLSMELLWIHQRERKN